MEIVDHKLWRSKAARAVRKTSNRNQMALPRRMTTLYIENVYYRIFIFETFSTPDQASWLARVVMGWGAKVANGRSTIASGSHCSVFFVCTQNLRHAITSSKALASEFLLFKCWYSGKSIEKKPRFWNKSRTRLAHK